MEIFKHEDKTLHQNTTLTIESIGNDVMVIIEDKEQKGKATVHLLDSESVGKILKNINTKKKFKLTWEDRRENPTLIKEHGSFDTHEEAMQSIYDWWSKNEFSPPYIRTWLRDNVATVDYGSHYLFYKITEVN